MRPAAVEGGIVLSRFERHLGPGSRSAAELRRDRQGAALVD